MRLTSFTDYGLRTLMRLAGEPDRLFTTDEIAAEFRVSRHHLTKVVGKLASTGFIVTRRGVGGGFQLARAPSDIGIGDVVRVLEGDQPLVECFQPNNQDCTLLPGCRLKARLSRALDAFFMELDGATLAEFIYVPPNSPGTTSATVAPPANDPGR